MVNSNLYKSDINQKESKQIPIENSSNNKNNYSKDSN